MSGSGLDESLYQDTMDMLNAITVGFGQNNNIIKYNLQDIPRHKVDDFSAYQDLRASLESEGYAHLSNMNDPRIFQRTAIVLSEMKDSKDIVISNAYTQDGRGLESYVSVFTRDKEGL